MKYDPDWKPHPQALMTGRGMGRTTRMMWEAVELAREPQTILMLFPHHGVTRWAWDHFRDLLWHNLPRDSWGYHRGDGLLALDVLMAEVRILTVNTPPGQFLSRGVHSLSILVDHSCEEYPPIYQREMVEWAHAINHVQRLNESKQTMDAARLALITSRS